MNLAVRLPIGIVSFLQVARLRGRLFRLSLVRFSDAVSIIAPGSSVGTGLGTLSNAIMACVNIPNYGLGAGGRHALWVRSDAIGSLTVSNSAVVEHLDASAYFIFNFVTNVVPIPPPPAQKILAVTLNGNGSLTINYAATAGCLPYRDRYQSYSSSVDDRPRQRNQHRGHGGDVH